MTRKVEDILSYLSWYFTHSLLVEANHQIQIQLEIDEAQKNVDLCGELKCWELGFIAWETEAREDWLRVRLGLYLRMPIQNEE